MQRQPQSWTARLGFGARNEEIEVLQMAINYYLDLYLDIVILEELSQGNLPALEGIRLVRERVKPGEEEGH